MKNFLNFLVLFLCLISGLSAVVAQQVQVNSIFFTALSDSDLIAPIYCNGEILSGVRDGNSLLLDSVSLNTYQEKITVYDGNKNGVEEIYAPQRYEEYILVIENGVVIDTIHTQSENLAINFFDVDSDGEIDWVVDYNEDFFSVVYSGVNRVDYILPYKVKSQVRICKEGNLTCIVMMHTNGMSLPITIHKIDSQRNRVSVCSKFVGYTSVVVPEKLQTFDLIDWDGDGEEDEILSFLTMTNGGNIKSIRYIFDLTNNNGAFQRDTLLGAYLNVRALNFKKCEARQYVASVYYSNNSPLPQWCQRLIFFADTNAISSKIYHSQSQNPWDMSNEYDLDKDGKKDFMYVITSPLTCLSDESRDSIYYVFSKYSLQMSSTLDTSFVSASDSMVNTQVWHLDNDTVQYIGGYYIFYQDSVCKTTKIDSVFLQTKSWQSVDSCSGNILNNWMVDSSFTKTKYIDSCYVYTTYIDTVLATGISVGAFGNIKVYPNPTQHTLYIDGLVSFEIINALGQRIVSGKNSNQGNVFEIDVSGFAAGVYFLNLNVDDQFWLSRIIKE